MHNIPASCIVMYSLLIQNMLASCIVMYRLLAVLHIDCRLRAKGAPRQVPPLELTTLRLRERWFAEA